MMTRVGQLNGVVVALLLAGSIVGSASAQFPSGPSASKAKSYAPGVRIDWTRRLVEVDAVIVLRQGDLELIACSPHTREHESIFTVSAKPLNVYQAMGLIGFEPGSPSHYDEKKHRWIKPSGHALDISVRFEKDGRRVDWPIEHWLLRNDTDEEPDRLPWIFTGSARIKGGRLAADSEGTLICVVDFAAALIAVGDRHSADDRLLWLRANTKAIPLIGTPCTLLISERLTLPLHLLVDSDGTIMLGTRVISVEEVVSTVKLLERSASSSDSASSATNTTQRVNPRGLKSAAQHANKKTILAPITVKPAILLKPENGEAAATIQTIISLLIEAGMVESRISVEPVSTAPASKDGQS